LSRRKIPGEIPSGIQQASNSSVLLSVLQWSWGGWFIFGNLENGEKAIIIGLLVCNLFYLKEIKRLPRCPVNA
jgi:hypothetical protein